MLPTRQGLVSYCKRSNSGVARRFFTGGNRGNREDVGHANVLSVASVPSCSESYVKGIVPPPHDLAAHIFLPSPATPECGLAALGLPCVPWFLPKMAPRAR